MWSNCEVLNNHSSFLHGLNLSERHEVTRCVDFNTAGNHENITLSLRYYWHSRAALTEGTKGGERVFVLHISTYWRTLLHNSCRKCSNALAFRKVQHNGISSAKYINYFYCYRPFWLLHLMHDQKDFKMQ